MALKKEICQKCWNGHGISHSGWGIYDEERWEEGCVSCPFVYLGKERRTRYITDSPPPNCPYLLEQVL